MLGDRFSPRRAQPAPETKRKGAASAIVVTARKYFTFLTRLKELFLDPLQEQSRRDSSLLSAQQVKAIFSSLEAIYTVTKALTDDFNKIFSGEWSPSFVFGPLLCKLDIYIKSYYLSYFTNLNFALYTLGRARKDNPRLATFLKNAEEALRAKYGHKDLPVIRYADSDFYKPYDSSHLQPPPSSLSSSSPIDTPSSTTTVSSSGTPLFSSSAPASVNCLPATLPLAVPLFTPLSAHRPTSPPSSSNQPVTPDYTYMYSDLPSALLAPIHFLPKYKALIQTLLSATTPETQDAESIQEHLNVVSATLQDCLSDLFTQHATIIQQQSIFSFTPSFLPQEVISARKLLRAGFLTQLVMQKGVASSPPTIGFKGRDAPSDDSSLLEIGTGGSNSPSSSLLITSSPGSSQMSIRTWHSNKDGESWRGARIYVRVLLFTDVLVIADAQQNEYSLYPLAHVLQMNEVTVDSADGGADAGEYGIRVYSSVAELFLLDSDKTSREQWLSLFHNVNGKKHAVRRSFIISDVPTEASTDMLIKQLSEQKLKRLHLAPKSIRPAQAMTLAQAITASTSLTYVSLSQNNLDDTVVSVLSSWLAEYNGLRVLRLDHNEVTAGGAIAIADALRYNTSLEDLSLNYNRIGDHGVTAICTSVLAHPSITTLNVTHNDIKCFSQFSRSAIRNLLCFNKTLSEFLIAENFNASDSSEVVGYLAGAIVGARVSALGKIEWDVGSTTEAQKVVSEKLQANVSRIRKASRVGPEGSTSPRAAIINSNNPASQSYIDTLDMGYAGYVDISTTEINITLKGVSLGSITSLCLDHNTLFQIGQPVLQSLVHLRSLLLSHNRFETVPPSIKLLTNLTMLDFSHNRLTRFPKEVIYLINLQELDLSFNSIHSFGRETTKHLGRLSRLWRLALHRNFLTSVPTALFHLTRLTYLSVTSNPAISLAKQKLYENFVDKNPLLDLSRCFLKSVPIEIEILTHLTTLDLSYNSLENLPPHVSKLTSLQTLSLAHNQLASLPWQLSKITKLTRLSLAGNPRLLAAAQAHATALNPSLPIGLSLHALQSAQTLIRPEFVEREIDAQKMMSNFKEPVAQYPCSRMKLMLVGQENVGKTSLAQALRKSSQRTSKFPTILTSSAKNKLRRVTTVGNILGDPAAPTWGHYSPTASHYSSPVASPNQFNTIGTISSTSAAPLSTDGIDMEEWTPPSTEDPISFQVWDFGGQEVYYLTHQFFLKNGRCVFLLVFSLELGYDANRIEYWLRVVEERARDSSVILVGTHLDSITEEKAATILADLQSKYQRNTNVKCAVAVSCKTNRYMEKLKDLIISLSSSDVKMKETFPLSFFQLESVLLAEKENRVPPLMTMVEFRNTARACGVLHNDIPRAMDFLVQLGNIVYFNDSNVKLEDVVILDPRWLTKFMATLITTKPTFVQNGVLSRHHLEQVWRPPEYPSDIHHSLLSLLHKFEICFPFPAREKGYLVPSLLPANRPVLAHFVADPLTRLERLYRFHTPLYGFFSRLMVRLLHFMDGIQYWRDGILLGQHDTFALLEFKTQSQQMQVRVWGQHACRWLRNIMESIDILLTGWYYTKVSIVIPCVCSVCAPIDSNTLPTNFRSPKPTRDRRVLKKSESAGTPENATKNRILSTIGKINKSTPPASPSTREISQSAEIIVPPNMKPAASNALTLSSSAPSLSTRPPRPPRALPRAAGTPMTNPLLDSSGGVDPLIPSPRSTNPSLGSSVPSPRDPLVSPRSATPSSPSEAYRPGPLSPPSSYKPGPASPPGHKPGPSASPNGFKQGPSSPPEARPSMASRPISPPVSRPFAASSRPSSPPSPLRASTAPSSPASPTSPTSTSPSSTPITIPSSASSPSIPSSVPSAIPATLATSPSSPPTFSTSPTSASLSTSPTSASLSTSPSAILTPPPHLVTPPPSPIPRNMITITKARSSSVFEDKPPVIPTLSSSLSAPNNLDQQVSTSRDRSYSIGHQTIYGGQRAYITYDKCEEAIAKFEQTILCPRGGGVVQLSIITPELLLRDVQEETDIDIVDYNSLAIGKVVAQGGFGTVCETVYNDEVVAIKTRTFLDSDAVSEMREFRREAWLSSSISHRTIVALRGITLSPPDIPHGTLHNFLHSRQVEEVSQKMRLTILHNIADALRHLHSRTPKICHRDLKPRNCLMVAMSLDAEEIANEEMKGGAHVVCKLADFGESRSVVVSATGRDNLGNPLWLAPEVIRAEVYTEKADVFSFGIVAYEVLTHQDPYSEYPIARGNFMAKLEDKIITGLRPTLPPSTPDDLRRLIETCWDSDPNVRPSFLDIYAKIKQMVKAQL